MSVMFADAAPAEVPQTDIPGVVLNQVVAVVDGEPVTALDLPSPKVGTRAKSSSDQRLRDEVDRVAFEKLILKEAQKRGIAVTAEMLAEYEKQILARNNLTQTQFLKELRAQGYTRKEYLQKISLDLTKARIVQTFLGPIPEVSEAQVDKFISSNPRLRPPADKLKLELLKLKPGEKLRKTSEFTSHQNYRHAGYVSKKDLREDLLALIDKARPGVVSGPHGFADGVYYFRYSSGARSIPGHVREQIKQKLHSDQIDKMLRDYYNKELLQKYEVTFPSAL